MAIQVGDVVCMDYGEAPPVIHARLVLAEVDAGQCEYIILTPDRDVYLEILDGSNPDLHAFHLPGPNGGFPPGVPRAHIYGFAPLGAREYAAFMRAGRLEADAEIARRGGAAVAPPAAPLAALAVNPAPVAGARVWVLGESCGTHKIGEQLTPPPGPPCLGDFGLVQLLDETGTPRVCLMKSMLPEDIPLFCEERIAIARAAEALDGDDRVAADDIRTLSIKYGVNGERRRAFKETVSELSNTEMEDFPLQPRTCLSYLQAISSVAESSYAQHLQWVQNSKIPDGARAVYEDEALSNILDMALTYDGLCVSNLACFELLVRRKQLLAEAHSYNPAQPSYDGSEHWMGNRFKPGGAIVVPALSEYVAKKMHEEAQILKERRKLEENKPKKQPNKPSPKQPPKGGAGASRSS